MDKPAVKDLVYGGLQELLRNRDYYYHSGVNSKYSSFTDQGVQAITEYLNTMAWLMIESENEELDRRAKEMVINGLKGDSQP